MVVYSQVQREAFLKYHFLDGKGPKELLIGRDSNIKKRSILPIHADQTLVLYYRVC